MKTYIDENGYERNHSSLTHRQIAYQEIYIKNRDMYPLPFRNYVVHHKDENKLNNSIENLEIMLQKDHEQLHSVLNAIKYPQFTDSLTRRIRPLRKKPEEKSSGSILPFIILTLIIIFLAAVYYEQYDCLFTKSESYQIVESRFYQEGVLLDGTPTFEYVDTEFHPNGQPIAAIFTVHNPYEFDITVEIHYKTKSLNFGDGTGYAITEVRAKNQATVRSQHANAGPVSEPQLTIIKPALTESQESITKQRSVCE